VYELIEFLKYLTGFIIGALVVMWRYRRLIAYAVQWVTKAYKDEKITREELADFLEGLGRKLREESP